MDNPKQQIVERIKAANNVLVTVSANPSVDQLSAAIGFGLLLNKLGKHATAVFSGKAPSTIEFLHPEKTLEKTTDSLRDFIIALDKSKADKLRYKVEDEHVKIFITPYRTSISQADLEFSQGDFNVDVVVALGVREQKDLDQAITAHGRILHDATVVSITKDAGSTLGSLNWVDGGASSLCEMLASLSDMVQPNALDGQMATALLTGIVAETARFSNEKTSSATMSISARLMAAGANQQLVAEQLQPKPLPPPPPPVEPSSPAVEAKEEEAPPTEDKPSDGSLHISHDPEPYYGEETPEDQKVEQIHIDDQGQLQPMDKPGENSGFMTTPPANAEQNTIDAALPQAQPGPDDLSLPPVSGGFLNHDSGPAHIDNGAQREPDARGGQTLTDIEHAVSSPHVGGDGRDIDEERLETARKTVSHIENGVVQPLSPTTSLNAQPLDLQAALADQPAESADSTLFTHYAPEPTVVAPSTQSSPPPMPPPMMPAAGGLPPEGAIDGQNPYAQPGGSSNNFNTPL